MICEGCKHLAYLKYRPDSIMCGDFYRCELMPDVICKDIIYCNKRTGGDCSGQEGNY